MFSDGILGDFFTHIRPTFVGISHKGYVGIRVVPAKNFNPAVLLGSIRNIAPTRLRHLKRKRSSSKHVYFRVRTYYEFREGVFFPQQKHNNFLICSEGLQSTILRGYTAVNSPSNGKWTLWRCISYWEWWFSIAMLVYQRVYLKWSLTSKVCLVIWTFTHRGFLATTIRLSATIGLHIS